MLSMSVAAQTSANRYASAQTFDPAELALVASAFFDSTAPEKQNYRKLLEQALESDSPILALDSLDDSKAKKAQEIVLADERIQQSAFEPSSKQALRSEVMSVKPALPGDRPGSNSPCWEKDCYRVDIYNFFFNATISSLVDIEAGAVVAINSMSQSQPELSDRLKTLAVAIAKHEPAVQVEMQRYLEFIGDARRAENVTPLMVDTKSSLKDTLCERSRHLCVAPTYVLGDKAMWVIVDLTDMKVAGLRWTDVGSSGPPPIVTERILENEFVFKNFCEKVNQIDRNGWSFDYHITSSDGLRIGAAKYQSVPVFDSAKVVDWHVSYSAKDKFGYSDATGCPMFSSAVVVAFDEPDIEPILEDGKEIGFFISQEFQQQSWPSPCNYRYEERYEFYNDGRYRTAMVGHGRGCGSNGTYRPVLRLDFAAPQKGDSYNVEQWSEKWQAVTQEAWFAQGPRSSLSSERFSHRLVDEDQGGYLIEPSSGQFNDGGRGDNAFIYFTVNHPDKDEGRTDLVTLGSCCNTNFEQGPEKFLQPAEPLTGEQITLWYVPQISNDGRKGSEYCWAENQVVDGVLKTKTWPCVAGPMFVPIKE